MTRHRPIRGSVERELLTIMALCVLFSSLLLISSFTGLTHASKDALPSDMHQDMYCIGCEMTMKVVDGALRKVPVNQLETAVPEALRNVCQPDLFKISEYPKDVITTACKYITKNYGAELKSVLISEYRRKKRASYLDLVQRVCLTLTDACHGVLHDDHDHDPLKDDARVKLDPDTNQFVVLPGKNLKVASPVRGHNHEEL